jgi:hypothetical protein
MGQQRSRSSETAPDAALRLFVRCDVFRDDTGISAIRNLVFVCRRYEKLMAMRPKPQLRQRSFRTFSIFALMAFPSLEVGLVALLHRGKALNSIKWLSSSAPKVGQSILFRIKGFYWILLPLTIWPRAQDQSGGSSVSADTPSRTAATITALVTSPR